jgi:hypothetical protein
VPCMPRNYPRVWRFQSGALKTKPNLFELRDHYVYTVYPLQTPPKCILRLRRPLRSWHHDSIVLLYSLRSPLCVAWSVDTCVARSVVMRHVSFVALQHTSSLTHLCNSLLDRPPPVLPQLLFPLILVNALILAESRQRSSSVGKCAYSNGQAGPKAQHGWECSDCEAVSVLSFFSPTRIPTS